MSTPTPNPFTSVLIANRGEIACRIIKTAKAMGLKTIAVYSDADAKAPHVTQADQAVPIGPSPASESYLVIDKILDAAKQSGAEAIHPGYGFLSENVNFANACKAAGIIFIGPEPDAILLMGDKAKSKRRMLKAGVPCVPGYQGKAQDDETFLTEARSIGFPVMVKASAGGGGRGMRLVESEAGLLDALKDARNEAFNAFGSDILILERAVSRPRHVEIQIFADTYGHTLHLGERDCSVQRRHQKILEEAPCPVLTPALRDAMGASAVKAAKDIGYVGAGTVEFMLDDNGAFYFLEMNTRLQVEHPVTEMITNRDLVALQIQIARGEPLGLTQDDIILNGHAIEARLYAEDPSADFLPATGPITVFKPASGSGIRIDSGVTSGSSVSSYYDPMIAKLIAHGPSREDARLKLVSALKDTVLLGVKTNQAFLIKALECEDFKKGRATTAFISENFQPTDLKEKPLTPEQAALSAIVQFVAERESMSAITQPIPCALMNWSSASKITTPYQYGNLQLFVTPRSNTDYEVRVQDRLLNIRLLSFSGTDASLQLNGVRYSLTFYIQSTARLDLCIEGQTLSLVNSLAEFQSARKVVVAGSVIAPMHGALLEVFVEAGDLVTNGQRLAIIEAMKMQHEILAEIDGTIRAVHVTQGTQIASDTLMMDIDPKLENETL